MSFVQMVQFIEQAYALVQQLKADGTYAKVVAAEQAIMTEIETNPSVKQLETLVESFFAKKAVAPTA